MFHDIVLGSLSAVSVVPFIQPMVYRKNLEQGSGNLERSVKAHYRGCRGFAASFVPTVALQTAVNGSLSKYLDPLSSAVIAGLFSAVIVCPAEAVMIQQQLTNKSYQATVKTLWQRRAFFRAFTMTAVREGGFSGAYLGLTPLFKRKFLEMGASEGGAQIGAGIAAGLISATVGQPCDTYKTQVQQNFSLRINLWRGITQQGAFLGLKWRCAMAVISTIGIPSVQEKLNS